MIKSILIHEYQHESNTNRHDFDSSQHESEAGLDQILLKIWDQLNYEPLPFNKGIYFIKYCVIIYSNYIQESFNVKSISETQGPLTPSKKTKDDLNFKENDLKLQCCVIPLYYFNGRDVLYCIIASMCYTIEWLIEKGRHNALLFFAFSCFVAKSVRSLPLWCIV